MICVIAQDLPGEVSILVMMPADLLATKIEAFQNRGQPEPYESRDLEDIISLLDGRESILEEAAASNDATVRQTISQWASAFQEDPQCPELIEAHLPRGQLFDDRAQRVRDRISALAALKMGPGPKI